MKRLLVLLWVSNTFVASKALAKSVPYFIDELKASPNLCYGREYLDHEIQMNSGQIVKHIRVSLIYLPDTDAVDMRIQLSLIPNKSTASSQQKPTLQNYEVTLPCVRSDELDGHLICVSECIEGGGAMVSWDMRKPNLNTVIFTNLGTPLRHCSDEDLKRVKAFRAAEDFLPRNRGNKHFTLFALPENMCQ